MERVKCNQTDSQLKEPCQWIPELDGMPSVSLAEIELVGWYVYYKEKQQVD